MDGWVLLLGVDYKNCTSLHLADYRAKWAGKETEWNASAMLQDGRRVWVRYYDEAVAADDFSALGQAFEAATAEVIIGKVAQATCKLMRQRPLVDFAVQWIESQRPKSLQSCF